VVEKNPLWWDKPEHNLDRVEFDVISSASTRVAALLSGEVDMIYSVPPQDMARIEQTPGLQLIQHPELRTIYLGFNFSRDELPTSDVKGKNPLRDVRVRQAIGLAIDEPAITSRVMLGLGQAKGVGRLIDNVTGPPPLSPHIGRGQTRQRSARRPLES
jgi:peptide/nickel transport system substrate-binding protein